MANHSSSNEEPNTAPEPDRWYNIKLGSSFQDHYNHSSSKFCTLRYEFKPASIDKSQPGSLHKSKDNRVTVEYHNNQQGKPKVTFEGISEDYKENDAVLFFDGETFHLERLHRAVKRLRHVRLPGESAAAATSATFTLVPPAVETLSPPVGKAASLESLYKGMAHQTPVQVEQIGTGDSESLELEDEKSMEHLLFPSNPSTSSPDPKNESEEQVDIINDDEDDDDDGCETVDKGNASEKGLSRTGLNIDINLPHQAEIDDEIADVDISDDDIDKGPNAAEALKALTAFDKGPNAAEALKALNAEEGMKGQNSSSSSSSGSDSSGSESGSRSGSSSSDSESSGGDSVLSI